MTTTKIAFQDRLTRDEIFALFDGRCLVCSRPAENVHEIMPKSLNPSTWWYTENRVALCRICHDEIHSHGAINYVDRLTHLREEYFANKS